jgi:uncharacterized protein (DUF2141 family)
MDTAAFALLCLAAAAAAQQAPCTLTVQVDGFRNQKGTLGVRVFKTSDGWPEQDGKALFDSGFPIAGKERSLHVSLPPGRYAVAVLHDENSNHKMDRNLLGIPKEGFGFSDNPKVWLSAPPFDAAAFDLACPATDVRIHLIYK